MPIFKQFQSLDKYFRETSGKKIIVNDLNFYREDEKKQILETIMTVYETDIIPTIPSCDCGAKKGKYLMGKFCNNCLSEVKDPFDTVDPILWFRKLDGMHDFISPQFWLMLRSKLFKNIDMLRYLSDTQYNPRKDLPNWYAPLIKTLPNFERSYNYLVEHLEDIMIFLINNSTFKASGKDKDLRSLLEIYRTEKDKIFSKYMPKINKSLFVMEKSNKGKFTNLVTADIKDAVLSFLKAVSDEITDRKKSNVTARFLSKMADVTEANYRNYFSRKEGIFRKHAYGARSHFTARCVITPITGPHFYNEVHLPWAVGVVVLRPHILNKLIKRGYDYNTASNMVVESVKKFNPVISDILDELLEESPYKSIPILAQRNPSLLIGSAVATYATKIKKDPRDNTMGISVLIAPLGNADFDG